MRNTITVLKDQAEKVHTIYLEDLNPLQTSATSTNKITKSNVLISCHCFTARN